MNWAVFSSSEIWEIFSRSFKGLKVYDKNFPSVKVVRFIQLTLDYFFPLLPNTCFDAFQIKNFTFQYKIKKIQNKEKRNYYSTTDTVQVWES